MSSGPTRDDSLHQAAPLAGEARGHGEAVDAPLVGENPFEILADTAPAMLWMTEPDGRCTFLNRRWYESTGQAMTQAWAWAGSTPRIPTTGPWPARADPPKPPS